MKTYRIATIPGDGIGKEVVPAGQMVLQALAAAGPFAHEDVPGLRPVRERAAHAHPARHRRAAEALRPEGVRDARANGRTWWPWALVTLAAGSFGPLGYLLWPRRRGAPAGAAITA